MGRKKLAAILAAAVVLLSGCSPLDESELKRLALPIAGSDRSEPMWHLWLGAWITTLVVFVVVFALILYAPIRYRRRRGEEAGPSQIRYNLPIEVLYTITPVMIVSVFFFHTVQAQSTMLEDVENPDHTIEVVGSKWQWTFNYLEPEATDGETVYDQGDTEHLPDLYLPVNESVEFQLTSPDVIHSFWVPEFYFKMDVFPGSQDNSFTMTPNREGTFTGRCAEFCGIYHTRMLFNVHVVSRDEYDAHLEELEEAGQIGRPQGPSEATKIAGTPDDRGE
ncbi:cytochrome c oxidase subunit II [Aeromicrobium camelliae]|uniref:aa3-type cytochrome oxidase subunit II n=1 Tax=Aeromicrobium camelliae TaxID=1538144 RepID=UPI001FB67A0E|nr:cytochrome c oxidase subunit II [Aeromicrobium camelliae]